MSVLIAGNTVLDIHLPVEGTSEAFEQGFTGSNVEFLSDSPSVVLGGNGGATAYAVGRLGVPVQLNSAIGTDATGQQVAEWLQVAGVHLVSRPSGTTAMHVLRSRSTDGARSSSFYPGPQIDWAVGTDGFQSGWFFASGYGGVDADGFERLVPVLESIHQRNQVVLDPGPWFVDSVSRDRFRGVAHFLHCLTGTVEELATWSSGDSPESLIEDYLTLGVECVVVKMGRDGVAFGTADGATGTSQGSPVERAHAVGAGDTFNGALLAGLYERMDIQANVERAVELASKAVGAGRGVLGAFDSA